MIQNLIIWNYFFENIISGIQRFYIWPDVPVDIISIFFNFRLSSRNSCRKSQSQENLAKKYLTFYNTISPKKPYSFYEPQLT